MNAEVTSKLVTWARPAWCKTVHALRLGSPQGSAGIALCGKKAAARARSTWYRDVGRHKRCEECQELANGK